MDCYDSWYYYMPTRVVFGAGMSKTVGKEAKGLGATRAFLVTDQGVHRAGVTAGPLQSLREAGLDPVVFADVEEDPPIATVERGLELFRESGCDLVVAVGGGSPMCAGKAIALRATNPGSLRDYEGFDRYDIRPVPTIAVPTTAGSGSEISQVFVISDPERKAKMAIGGRLGFPVVAILDPDLTMNLPYWQAIVSGVDALTHAVEGYVGLRASPFSDCLATEAVRLIFQNLGPAASTADKQAKCQMLIAASLANMACGNAKLGLGHGTSDPLCANYHWPHGYCNGLMLPFVMQFNMPAAPERYITLAEVMGEVPPLGRPRPEAAIEAVQRLYRLVGFPRRLPDDVKPEALPQLAQEGYDNPVSHTNIRTFTYKDVLGLYEAAMRGW